MKSIFLSVDQGQVIRAKNFRISGNMFFFHELNHLEWFGEKNIGRKFLVENFLSVEPGSGHKGKNFSNFW